MGDMIDAKTALDLGMVNRVVPTAELPAASLKYAKRLALISPEALAWTKLSINRGLEAGGFRSAMNAGVDIVSPLYAAKTEFGMKFQEIKSKDGLGAALNGARRSSRNKRRAGGKQRRRSLSELGRYCEVV